MNELRDEYKRVLSDAHPNMYRSNAPATETAPPDSLEPNTSEPLLTPTRRRRSSLQSHEPQSIFPTHQPAGTTGNEPVRFPCAAWGYRGEPCKHMAMEGEAFCHKDLELERMNGPNPDLFGYNPPTHRWHIPGQQHPLVSVPRPSPVESPTAEQHTKPAQCRGYPKAPRRPDRLRSKRINIIPPPPAQLASSDRYRKEQAKRYVPEALQDVDSQSMSDMRANTEQKHLVVLQTNICGMGGAGIAMWAKLDALFYTASTGQASFILVSETKITTTRASLVAHRYRNNPDLPNVDYLLGAHDDSPGGGCMLIWNTKLTGYGAPTDHHIDDGHKRALVATFPGSNGHRLTIASVYLESHGLPQADHERLYGFLHKRLPPPAGHRNHNPKHLAIVGGDFNTTVTEGPPDRWSATSTTPAPPGVHFRRFRESSALTELVRHHNPAPAAIHTHTAWTNGAVTSLAHLSHLLVPRATLAKCVAAGWTTRNTLFQSADHGVCWASFTRVGLDLPTPAPNQEPTNERQARINLEDVGQLTHPKQPHFPVRLLHQLNQPSGNREITMTHIADLLETSGYDQTTIAPYRRSLKILADDIALKGSKAPSAKPNPAPRTRYTDAIRFHNQGKEWWATMSSPAHAAHIISRGKGLPPTSLNEKMTTLSVQGCVWTVTKTAGTARSKRIRSWVDKVLLIPKEALAKPGTQLVTGTNNTWHIRFKTSEACSYWSKIGTDFSSTLPQGATPEDHTPPPSPAPPPIIPDPQPVFAHATGWVAFKQRIEEYCDDPNSTVSDPEVRRLLRKLATAVALSDPGELEKALNLMRIESMCRTVHWALRESARRSFGEKVLCRTGKASRPQSATYFAMWSTLKGVLDRLGPAASAWPNNFRAQYTRTLRDDCGLPSALFLPEDTTPALWKARVNPLADEILSAHRARRKAENTRHDQQKKETLDNAFVARIDKFLNNSIGPPKKHSYGADWATDDAGCIIQDPGERRAHNAREYEIRGLSTTKKPQPNSQRDKLLTALKGASSGFSPAEQEVIEAPLQQEDLDRALAGAGASTAPGLTGIGYQQWKLAPKQLHALILAMFNRILRENVLPSDFLTGMVFPIPKDPLLPATGNNARPLTMLETGLKLLTSCIMNRIQDSMTRTPVLCPTQSAFLPGSNIRDLTRLVETAQKSARDEKRELHMGFLDLKQAFERVEPWASDLALERLGIPASVRDIFNTLDTSSSRRLATRDGLSDEWRLECGVPQGEVASPFRFIALMDMLAAWLQIRCEGHNPTGAKMGFPFKLADFTRRSKILPWATQEQRTVRGHSFFFCDDICLMASSHQELQDMVAVVSEFMQIVGIPLNAQKSYYTRWDPESQAEDHQEIHTKVEWKGGLDGSWVPATDSPHLTYKRPDEAIRYLGIHFAMNGSWEKQLEIIEARLDDTLRAIHYKEMTMKQMSYMMNTVVIPALTYALAVPGLHWAKRKQGADGHRFRAKLDTEIRGFALRYFHLGAKTTTHLCHAPLASWGLGLDSVDDLTHTNIITDCHTSLNDWDLSKKWQAKAGGPSIALTNPEGAQGPHPAVRLHTLYRDAANMYSAVLLGLCDEAYSADGGLQAFPLSRACTQPKMGGGAPSTLQQITYFLSKVSYSIDSPLYATPRDDPPPADPRRLSTTDHRKPSNSLAQTISDGNGYSILSCAKKSCLQNDLSHLRQFLEPCGSRILSWSDFVRRTRAHTGREPHPLNKPFHNNQFPEWWMRLKLLISTYNDIEHSHLPALSKCGLVKKQYRDTPFLPLTGDIPWLLCTPTSNPDEIYVIAPRDSSQPFSCLRGPSAATVFTFLTPANAPPPNQPHAGITHSAARLATVDVYNHSLTWEGDTEQAPLIRLLCAPAPTSGGRANPVYQPDLLRELAEHSRETSRHYWALLHGAVDSDDEAEDLEISEADAHSYLFTDGSCHASRGAMGAAVVRVSPPDNVDHRTIETFKMNITPATRSWHSTSTHLSHDPAPCTSYTAEMTAILLALTSLRTHPAAGAHVEAEPDEEMPPPTLATDSMASKTKIGAPHEHTTVRETIRTDEHYTLTSIHGLLAGTPLRFKHVSAHTGDRFNTLADSQARRAAWRPRPHPPPRFPPDTSLHFHLFFCDNLVNMDSRAHTRAVHVAKHLQEWRSKGSQGLLRQQAHSRNQELKRAGISSHTRWADKFYTKLFANILPTQATRFSRASEHYPCESKACPHCPATEPENQEDGTAEHLFLRCKHPSFTTLRQELDEQLLQALQPPGNPRRPTADSLPFMGSFSQASHPAALIHPACLYPHTPHLWDPPGDTPLILDALPEARFYSKEGNIISLLKAGHPNAPALPVLDTEFWRLIATHPTTHGVVPQARSVYDARASDIYALLDSIPRDLAQDKLSWTTPHSLMRILIEEFRPTRELFSHALNTHYLIPEHCTLPNDALAPFSHDITYLVDGLDRAHYKGSVIANPPYDGVTADSTVWKSVGQAQSAAVREIGFRSVFIIPTTATQRATLLESATRSGANIKIVATFPNDTVPFIPAHRWRDGGFAGKAYQNAHASLTILTISSSNSGDLLPVNHASLNSRLAEWYMSVAPASSTTPEDITSTGIPPTSFPEALDTPAERLPREWRFWRHRPPSSTDEAYVGGECDSYRADGLTPCADIINSSPILCLGGALPDSFNAFLLHLGHKPAATPAVRKRVKAIMASFLKGSWLAFADLERAYLQRERGTPRPTPSQEAQPPPVQPPEPPVQPPPPPPPLLTPALVLPILPPPTEPTILPALSPTRHHFTAPPLCPGCEGVFLCTCCPSPPSSLTDTHSSPHSDSDAG